MPRPGAGSWSSCALLLLTAACRPALTVTPCSTRTDCPDGYSCDEAKGYCFQPAAGDGASLDGAGRDLPLQDAAATADASADATRADSSGGDRGDLREDAAVSHDAQAIDAALLDQAAADVAGGPGDAGPSELHTPDLAGDQQDAARADQASSLDDNGAAPDAGSGGDASPGVDAAALDSSQPTWVRVLAGSFVMGSPTSELGRWEPGGEVLHSVELTHDFEMRSTELTQGEFQDLMAYNPSVFSACGADCPVDNVTWHEAALYCNALSVHQGLVACYDCTPATWPASCELGAGWSSPYDCPGYRLPTEAEWEYAARAGTLTATYNGDLDAEHLAFEFPNPVLDPIAWVGGNSGDSVHPGAQLRPNAFGLHDMLGNTFEWCHDWWADIDLTVTQDPWGPEAVTTGTGRLTRGGSALQDAQWARAAFRNRRTPESHFSDLGFRPVRSLP